MSAICGDLVLRTSESKALWQIKSLVHIKMKHIDRLILERFTIKTFCSLNVCSFLLMIHKAYIQTGRRVASKVVQEVLADLKIWPPLLDSWFSIFSQPRLLSQAPPPLVLAASTCPLTCNAFGAAGHGLHGLVVDGADRRSRDTSSQSWWTKWQIQAQMDF